MPIRHNEDQAIEQTQPRKQRNRVSDEERRRIVHLVYKKQNSMAAVARLLDIPESTVNGIIEVFRKEGRTDAKPSTPPHKKKITEEHEQQILVWLNDNPTYTNKELAQKLEQQFSVHVSHQTISKITVRNNLTFKAVHEVAVSNNEPRILQLRKEWADKFMANRPLETHLYYVDESGFNIYLHRKKGRFAGQRANLKMTGYRAPNFTLIAAIGIQGLAFDRVHLGAVNGDVFLHAMEAFLDVLDEKYSNEVVEGISVEEIPKQNFSAQSVSNHPQHVSTTTTSSSSIHNCSQNSNSSNDSNKNGGKGKGVRVHTAIRRTQRSTANKSSTATPSNYYGEHHDDSESSSSSEEEYEPPVNELRQDEREEGQNNSALIDEAEEAPGVSFPLNRKYKACIVLDNASIHKVRAVQELFARRKYGLIFLPPYSPALNPIEMAFSKIKASFKSLAIDSEMDTDDLILEACRTITPQDCEHFFAHSFQMLPLCQNMQILQPIPNQD